MKTIDDINFSGKRALIRVDFNVPLDKSFNVTDDNRIRATIPTLNKILKSGGSCVLMSHLGRPKDGPEDKFSLRHTIKTLESLLGSSVQFANDCIGEEARTKASGLKKGEVLLLENLRFYKEEEKGDSGFAEKLSKLGDIYVNDAFGTAHRAHASTTIVAQFFKEKCAGYVMAAELDNAKKVMEKATKPFTAIMGGAKISDKILIIEQLLDKVDLAIINEAIDQRVGGRLNARAECVHPGERKGGGRLAAEARVFRWIERQHGMLATIIGFGNDIEHFLRQAFNPAFA